MNLGHWFRVSAASVMFGLLAACASNPSQPSPIYIVFFHQGSADITPESRQMIDQAAAAIRKTHPPSVALASGVAVGDNVRLAEARFEVIRAGLISKGVPATLIARSSLPDAKLDAGLAGDTRVEIMLLAKAP